MRKVPSIDRLRTKQDLLNVCEHLHHADAMLYLKDIRPEDMKRLGASVRELPKIKKGLAARKRAEEAENRQLNRKKRALGEVQERLATIDDDHKSKMAILRKGKGSEDEITAKSRELTRLHVAMETLRELPDELIDLEDVGVLFDAMTAELEAIEELGTLDRKSLKQLQRMAKAITEKKEIISQLRRALSGARMAEEHTLQVNHKLSEIQTVTAQIKQACDERDAVPALEEELAELASEKKTLKIKETNLKQEIMNAGAPDPGKEATDG